MVTSCGFTGHRPQAFLFGYNEQCRAFKAFYQFLAAKISDCYQQGITTFLSGMALGTDLWCAMIVLEMKQRYKDIKLICVIPCDNQTMRWPPAYIEQYENILKQADKIVYTGHNYTWDCMLIRNRYLVDHSDCLLAVYDEQHSNPRSGTGYTVRYAKQQGKPVIIINPETEIFAYRGRE